MLKSENIYFYLFNFFFFKANTWLNTNLFPRLGQTARSDSKIGSLFCKPEGPGTGSGRPSGVGRDPVRGTDEVKGASLSLTAALASALTTVLTAALTDDGWLTEFKLKQ